MRFFVAPFLLLISVIAAAEKTPEIIIESTEPRLTANIRNHLTIASEPCNRSLLQLQWFRSRIPREVDAAARALGYYHARIENLTLDLKEDCWQLKLTVEPGPRVRVVSVKVQIVGQALEDPFFDGILGALPVKPGDPLNHGEYEKTKLLLKNLALKRGYFDARFSKHELKVDVRKNQAAIDLEFDSGPRHYIGPITIDQNILDPDFAYRYVNVAPGAPYSSEAVANLYRRFADSGLFRHIRIDANPVEGPVPEVPISVSLIAKKRHRYAFGVGFDTNTGPRASFNYLNRYVNRRGHQFKLELRYTPVEPRATATYTIPLWDPLRESLRFNAGYRRRDVDSFVSDQGTLNIVFTHLRRDWTETLSLNLRYESSRVGTGEIIQSLIWMPTLGWARKEAEVKNRLVLHGHKFDFKLRGGVSLLGNSAHFLRLRMFGRYAFSLPWKARIHHRWEIGALATPAFGKLTAGNRFFTGGDNSIRGYKYLSLGPLNDQGEVIGGRYLGVVSVEYEQTVYGDWGVALFVDGGNAYNELKHLWRDRKFGGGVGLRWLSPVGLVRLDFAVPLNHQYTDFRIHFAIGPVL